MLLDKKSLSPIGKVNKAVGFKGELSCLVTLAHPEKLLKHKFLFVIIDGLPVPFLIQEIEIRGEEEIMVKFEDVDSELSARKLSQKKIFAEKIRPIKKEDVVSWNDLTGYNVVDSADGVLGIITEVVEYPMQMIAKCMVKDKEVMFPLNDDIVTDIDETKKVVYVDLPEGLLEMYTI